MRPSRLRKRKSSRPTTRDSSVNSRTVEGKLLNSFAERLRQQDGLRDLDIVKNPANESKMSEVLREFMFPHMCFVQDAPSFKRLVSTATLAWNAALLPADERSAMLEELSQDFDSKTREDFCEAMGELIERKLHHFAQYRRTIVDVQVTDTEGGYHLAVATLLKP